MTIDSILTWEQPFGPNATEKIDPGTFGAILDDTNSAYASLTSSPFLIVGRRGSGKTSILSAIRLSSKFDYCVDVPSDRIFQQVVQVIDSSDSNHVFEETASEVWQKLAWNIIFVELVKNNSIQKNSADLAILRVYLKKIGLEPVSKTSQLIRFALQLIKREKKDAENALDALLDLFDALGTFESAKDSALNILKSRRQRMVILIDNVENINLDNVSVSLAVAGLLMAVDSFKESSIPIEVRCCIPAEVYPRLVQLAANSDKSFDSTLILKWSSKELIHLASIRFREFIRLNAPRHIYQKVSGLNLENAREMDTFFHTFFPRTVSNGEGVEEVTFRYILRHTQLLPRQVISYLNSIARQGFADGISKTFKFEPRHVIKGVADQEGLICHGVFGGYSNVFPSARKLCDLILPQLELTFERGDFQKAVRYQTGKLPDEYDEERCLHELIRIGAIGVVEDETSDYVISEFSYNLPLNLQSSLTDKLCVHPTFSGEFRCKVNLPKYKPIYPKGSDLIEH